MDVALPEPAGAVADRNGHRNITKRQKAMGHAMLFPEPESLSGKITNR